MEQVRGRISDDEILVWWHHSCSAAGRPASRRGGMCVTDSGEVIVVSRDGQCWEFPAGRPETEPELPSP